MGGGAGNRTILWVVFDVFENDKSRNPYKPGVLFMGQRQTEWPLMRRRVPSGATLFADMIFIEK